MTRYCRTDVALDCPESEAFILAPFCACVIWKCHTNTAKEIGPCPGWKNTVIQHYLDGCWLLFRGFFLLGFSRDGHLFLENEELETRK